MVGYALSMQEDLYYFTSNPPYWACRRPRRGPRCEAGIVENMQKVCPALVMILWFDV
jgi:hypothetical protein